MNNSVGKIKLMYLGQLSREYREHSKVKAPNIFMALHFMLKDSKAMSRKPQR